MQPNKPDQDQIKNSIILIEDDYLIADLYKSVLSISGFKIDVCTTGEEGLLALQQNNYDLLLLDLMLPDINGIEILKRVRREPSTLNLPVLVLTNLGQDTVIKEVFRLGANGYLIKTALNPDQIVQEVTKLLKVA